MKPRTEKQSKGIMRFFTPELYLQFRSADEAEADRADDAWEAVIKAYDRHLDTVRKKLPQSALSLAELCLHDWELLAFERQIPAAIKFYLLQKKFNSAWMSLQSGEQVIDLFYILCGGVREQVGKLHKKFGTGTKVWLYDEIDRYDGIPNSFVHRILWSDGKETEIPFYTAVIHTFSVNQNGSKRKARGIAS